MEKTNPVLRESQYPLPSEAQILLVTPEMASDWLTYRNYRNRRISKSKVAQYAADMKAGRWKTTRQGLIFDTFGKIIDGQHRLSAVANGEATVAFWVYPNEARDTFDVLDQGLKRNAAQMLGVPYSTTVASSARYLAALADQDEWGMPRFTKITNPEIFETIKAWPELGRYSTDASLIRLATWINASANAAVMAQAARTEHADKIPGWIKGLMTGDELSSYDARLKLRNRFMSSHHTLGGSKNRDQVYNLIAKSWNAYAQDQAVPILRWRVDEGFANVVGFDWDKQNKQEG